MVRPPAATITYTLAYEQESARIAYGLSPDEYARLPGTPDWLVEGGAQRSKCHVLIWYRMNNYIPAVAQDAQYRQMERDSKKHKKS